MPFLNASSPSHQLCQNGATCVDEGVGYQCLCPPGYTGVNCETDIPDCSPSSCPTGATCVDLVDGHYCRCPFNLTGEDCRKSEYRPQRRTRGNGAMLPSDGGLGKRVSYRFLSDWVLPRHESVPPRTERAITAVKEPLLYLRDPRLYT